VVSTETLRGRRLTDQLFPPPVAELLARREWEKLSEGFQRVLSRDPQSQAGRVGLALCLASRNQLKQAAQELVAAGGLWQVVPENFPDCHLLWLQLAEQLKALHADDAARQLVEQVVLDLEAPDELRLRARRMLARLTPGASPPAEERRLALPVLIWWRVLGVLLLILLGTLGYLAGKKSLAAYYLERGLNSYYRGLLLLERLEKGEPGARIPPEGSLEEAVIGLRRSLELEPSFRARFLILKSYERLVQAGALAARSGRPWTPGQIEDITRGLAAARQDVRRHDPTGELSKKEQDWLSQGEEDAREGRMVIY
jgi:tetratricopeptide (TPR) repeat protein